MNLPRSDLKSSLWRVVALGSALLVLPAGCAGPGHPGQDTAALRVLTPAIELAPPAVARGPDTDRAPGPGVRIVPALDGDDKSTPKPAEEELPPPKKQAHPELLPPPREEGLGELAPPRRLREETGGGSAEGIVTKDGVLARPLTLPGAVALAFQLQPRLRSALESIEQAARRQDIVHAAFLPVATTAYQVGGFHLNVGGEGIPLGQAGQQLAQAFTFIPFTGALPVGLTINTGYEIAELKVQWLICDFGRRLGRYNQAGLALDVARLQAERARQTVANEVAVTYYQVLRARALGRTAREAVRRAEDELEIARKLVKGGAEVREKVLRAQVQLAQARRALDQAEEAEGIAVAAFNLAVGLNPSARTQIADDPSAVPPFEKSLAECLQTAVNQRREFAVAQRAIASAQEGMRVAR